MREYLVMRYMQVIQRVYTQQTSTLNARWHRGIYEMRLLCLADSEGHINESPKRPFREARPDSDESKPCLKILAAGQSTTSALEDG